MEIIMKTQNANFYGKEEMERAILLVRLPEKTKTDFLLLCARKKIAMSRVIRNFIEADILNEPINSCSRRNRMPKPSPSNGFSVLIVQMPESLKNTFAALCKQKKVAMTNEIRYFVESEVKKSKTEVVQ
jgi:hypothetical protein